jgi:undecaprenyl diphosphate synthase
MMIPRHVAIIMDGNGRWAKSRGYPRFYGHIRGVSRVREIVREAQNAGIQALTLYAFSTENWKRPDEELNVLWKLLRKYIRSQVKELKKNGVKLNIIGEIERLPVESQNEIREGLAELKDGQGLQLTFAISYGARSEILNAVKEIATACAAGTLQPDEISEQTFEKHLWTSVLGDLSNVDFMIRTSGEMRISNYLLWQCSYAEFDFPETLWPDYSVEEFRKSLENFKNRNRRFGGT